MSRRFRSPSIALNRWPLVPAGCRKLDSRGQIVLLPPAVARSTPTLAAAACPRVNTDVVACFDTARFAAASQGASSNQQERSKDTMNATYNQAATGREQNFRSILQDLARTRSSIVSVFADFCRITACCLAMQTREDEYLQAVKGYTKDELNQLAQAMGMLRISITLFQGSGIPMLIGVAIKFTIIIR